MNSEEKTPETEAQQPGAGNEVQQATAAAGDPPSTDKDQIPSEEKAESKEKKHRKKKKDPLQEELDKQKEENSQLQERLLRISAEYDNFRKRSTKEKDGIYAEGVAGTVTQFIDVLDNLERALAASETEDDFTKGIAMVVTQFKAALEKLGVTEVDPAGGSFDPNLHNAVMHIEDDELGEGAIVDVFQKGYVMGDRVIRYAMVKVAN